jgi:hypothetical protein
VAAGAPTPNAASVAPTIDCSTRRRSTSIPPSRSM